MTGVIESSPGSGVAESPITPVETVPGTGGLEDANPASDSPFVISDEVMNAADLDEETIPAAAAAKATEPEAPAKAAEAKPAEAKPAVPATEAKPPVPAKPGEAKPATPAETKPAATSAAPRAAPPNLLEEVAKNRDALISHLAESRFKLTKEESDLLDTDANAAIQKIAARTYYEATTSTLNLLQKFTQEQLPALIEQHTQSTRVSTEAENSFFTEWPNLDRVADARTINTYANLYRQANPSASKEQAIKDVGTMVSALLNKPKVAAGAAPAARQNGARPFTPASGSARVVSQVPVPSANPFDGLGSEFD